MGGGGGGACSRTPRQEALYARVILDARGSTYSSGGHSPSLLMCLTLAPDLLSGRKSYTGNWLAVKSELRCKTALGIVATVKVRARGAPGY